MIALTLMARRSIYTRIFGVHFLEDLPLQLEWIANPDLYISLRCASKGVPSLCSVTSLAASLRGRSPPSLSSFLTPSVPVNGDSEKESL